jgi:Protein of unknown function (DUF1460)
MMIELVFGSIALFLPVFDRLSPYLAKGELVPVQASITGDREYKKLLEYAQKKQLSRQSIGVVLPSIAVHFLGADYQAGLLDRSLEEKLFISLKKFDCVLFVETVLALSRNFALGDDSYSSFTRQIENLRYRDGSINGYCSRLHYFSDWIDDNQRRGNVENITTKLGGITLDKILYFMSKNRAKYPQLKSNENYACIQQVEERLQKLPLTYIPTRKLKTTYPKLRAGDIIGVVTSIEGLDTTHTGFIYRSSNGNTGLIHASPAGQVTIAPDLQRYLSRVEKAIGIFVVRPLHPS